MSIENGWLSWATKIRPEIAVAKRYPMANQGEGIVWHSQEGTGLQSMISIMEGPRKTSFMFWLPRGGGLVQFAPVTASVWCSGNKHANTFFWPVEMEGFAGDPIEPAQLKSALDLIAEWKIYANDTPERLRTMWEHKEVATRWSPNAGGTLCPSGRYDKLWAKLVKEDTDMTPAEVQALIDASLVSVKAEQAKVSKTLARLNTVLVARFRTAMKAFDVDNPPGGG
jgi:hypothetical protein